MMQKINLNIKLLENAKGKPQYESQEASGLDLKAGINKNIIIRSKDILVIPTGMVLEIPFGYEAQVRPRSGLAAHNGISVLNSPGTIDSDYRGELKVILINLGKLDFSVEPGMKIAQLIIAPTIRADIKLVTEISSKTDRGDRGFGSTGL